MNLKTKRKKKDQFLFRGVLQEGDTLIKVVKTACQTSSWYSDFKKKVRIALIRLDNQIYEGVGLKMTWCHSWFSFATENKPLVVCQPLDSLLCYVFYWNAYIWCLNLFECVFLFFVFCFCLFLKYNFFFFSFLCPVSMIQFKISQNFKRQKMNICASLVTWRKK